VDPLYLIGTSGIANNTIRETPYTTWPGDLSNHKNGYFYRLHSDAPSYLDRFEDANSGSNGIESLVEQRLLDGGLAVSAKTAVDYIYFSVSNPASCNVVDIAAGTFELDDPTHTGYYGTSCI